MAKNKRIEQERARDFQSLEALSKYYFSQPQYWVDFSNSLFHNKLKKSKGRATSKIG